jgi:hypothetical protein
MWRCCRRRVGSAIHDSLLSAEPHPCSIFAHLLTPNEAAENFLPTLLHLTEQQNLTMVVDATLSPIAGVLLRLAVGLTDMIEADARAAQGREASLQSAAKVRTAPHRGLPVAGVYSRSFYKSIPLCIRFPPCLPPPPSDVRGTPAENRRRDA